MLPSILKDDLALPVIGAPLFIISNPELTLAQCKAGIIGAFPSLNARPIEQLDEWLTLINKELAEYKSANPKAKVAPYAVNIIVHPSNDRVRDDLTLCVKHKVPIVITSLGALPEVNEAIHSYGGITLHDVINNRHANSAIRKGADGLIAVASGAGGHAGKLSPFALIQEIREWFDGPLLLSGAIANGSAILAAQAMGADMAYIGSPFIATHEARASDEYKQAIADFSADDIVYTNYFTGVHGNYLKQSIINSGFDPDNLPEADPTKMDFASANNSKAKAWKDIWGCGQGIGAIKSVGSTQELVERWKSEYAAAKKRIAQL